MTAQHNGGPAFPTHGGAGGDDDPRNHTLGGGLSMRDWFAGQALAGIMANPELDGAGSAKQAAVVAYQAADAMLAARGGSHE